MTQKPSNASAGAGIAAGVALGAVAVGAAAIFVAVSYTHLTLPTKLEV